MIYYYPNRPFLIPPDSEMVQQKSDDPNWDAEIKWGGDRLGLWKTKEQFPKQFSSFVFWNRQNEIFKKYEPSPELLDELNSLELPFETALDGELLHFKTRNYKHCIVFYDAYIVGDQRCVVELRNRRDIMASYFKARKFKLIHMAEQFQTDFKQHFDKVIVDDEKEGLVMKDKNGKIQWNTVKSPDVAWQLKIRKPEKNYKF